MIGFLELQIDPAVDHAACLAKLFLVEHGRVNPGDGLGPVRLSGKDGHELAAQQQCQGPTDEVQHERVLFSES